MNSHDRSSHAGTPRGAALVMLGLALLGSVLLVGACERAPAPASSPNNAPLQAPAPTNRVDIPAPVRSNLGVTFARVEKRNVERTLRVPGHFELLPTARREYRAPLGGRIEVVVEQYQKVEAGQALFRVDSAEWRALQESIASVQAEVDSMPPLRAAHKRHEASLGDKVTLWEDRLRQLEGLRESGGGLASQFTEARAELNQTQAELADVMEKDAELEARQKQAEASLRALRARRDLLLVSARQSSPAQGDWAGAALTIAAVEPGVVESLNVTQGGLADESALVLSLVRPELVRFRGRALQSDLGVLRDGLPARVLSPDGAGYIEGSLTIGLNADASQRTIDLLVAVPQGTTAPPAWTREGVAASIEVTTDGGREELAVPLACVLRDGVTPVLFRRDPADPDKAIRIEADLGIDDGKWIVVRSGVKAGDEIVLAGGYQLMLATSGSATKGGHFHADGTFHAEEH